MIWAWPTKFFPAGCLLYALVLAANEGIAEYRFDVWTAESGLPQNTVRAILQSRDGYLWVATLDGLARFDGVRFTVFNKAASPGLPTNRILALYEDPQSDLWIGLGDSGLARYHQGSFTLFGQKEGLSYAGSIAGDERGDPWVCGRQYAFVHFKDGRFEPELTANPAVFAPEAIGGNRPGVLWATNQEGLHIFSRGKVTTLNASNGLGGVCVNQIDEDQHGNWWLATDKGLVKVRNGKVLRVYTQQDGLPRNAVWLNPGPVTPAVACEDSRGNLWVIGSGPWLGRLKDGNFSGYPSTNSPSSQALPVAVGLRTSQINALFEDREGNLWIGTEGSGLIRAREQAVNVLSTREGLEAANVYPVLEDRAGAVWLGCWERGLTCINEGRVTNFSMGGRDQLVTALCEDRAGQLWLGSVGRVAIFRDGRGSVAGVPPALTNHQTVNAICEDHNGVLWFGAEPGLFSYAHGKASLFTERDGVPGYISVIIESRAGELWIGSRGGLTRLDNGRFTTWTEQDGLPSNHVRALYEDGEGTLWIGTVDGGLGRFKDGRFTRYTTRDGLFDSGVFQILEDGRNNFWMSSNRGIHRVSKRELEDFAAGRRRTITAVAYGKRDGMLDAECNGGCWPAGVKTRDGKLWFPTQDGVAVIDPEAVPANPKAPLVVIEAVLLDREPQRLQGPVRVPPGKANIEIQYTGLSLVNSDRLWFKYRLAGADDDWVEAGTRRTAYYSHLAPRRYVFTVLAANSDGVWNDTGASLAFVLLPAWHQTWWFRGATLAGLVGAGFALVLGRLRSLERRQEAQRAFSRGLLQSQEAERRRIAAELHDSLGQNLALVKNLALLGDLGGAGPGKPPARDGEIAAAAERALEEVHAISYALRPPELDRLGLAKALGAMVRRAGEASGIRFETQIQFEGALPEGSDIHLFRIAQEAVNNLVQHSGAKTARVELWQDEGGVHLVVSDDGRGVAAAILSGSVGGHGLGLSGIEERARLIGAQCKWLSQPGKGTTLSVLVPPTAGN